MLPKEPSPAARAIRLQNATKLARAALNEDSSKRLKQIERQLTQLDADVLSFDHKEAEQAKAALVRIAEAAVALCYKIKADPSRGAQAHKVLKYDADAAMRQATQGLRASGGVTITKMEPTTFVRTK